ncbi:hypothetical protein NEMBOFW57_007942, partial [Staphylotrichum longicolle]
NMVAQYSALGCVSPADSACLCANANFGCAGTATKAPATSTATGIAALPSCGQLCFNNMLAQYASLGCAS